MNIPSTILKTSCIGNNGVSRFDPGDEPICCEARLSGLRNVGTVWDEL